MILQSNRCSHILGMPAHHKPLLQRGYKDFSRKKS